MDVVNRDGVDPFITKDTSRIREILSPRNAPSIHNQSLAEATLSPGAATQPHYHRVTEEVYYLLRGAGRIRVGNEVRVVAPGDGIAIPPGAPHQIKNTGEDDLVFLCCCVPAYTHDDTVLISFDRSAEREWD